MTDSRCPNLGQILTKKDLHRRTLMLEYERKLALAGHLPSLASPVALLLYKKKHQAQRLGGPCT